MADTVAANTKAPRIALIALTPRAGGTMLFFSGLVKVIVLNGWDAWRHAGLGGRMDVRCGMPGQHGREAFCFEAPQTSLAHSAAFPTGK